MHRGWMPAWLLPLAMYGRGMAADIGCDHGKLSAALAGSGRCPLVLACDLRPDPLQKARVTCALREQVQFRLGSGLEVLTPGEAEEIIIAGMGAETIIEILEAAPGCLTGGTIWCWCPPPSTASCGAGWPGAALPSGRKRFVRQRAAGTQS